MSEAEKAFKDYHDDRFPDKSGVLNVGENLKELLKEYWRAAWKASGERARRRAVEISMNTLIPNEKTCEYERVLRDAIAEQIRRMDDEP